MEGRAMNNSSVATHIATALEPHTRHFMRSEDTAHHNQSLAQGCSMTTDDDHIEMLVHDLFEDINTIIQRGHLVAIAQPEHD
jgi:hypothetical protein